MIQHSITYIADKGSSYSGSILLRISVPVATGTTKQEGEERKGQVSTSYGNEPFSRKTWEVDWTRTETGSRLGSSAIYRDLPEAEEPVNFNPAAADTTHTTDIQAL